jgi:hypothetical protein
MKQDYYEIRIQGYISEDWSNWFNGVEIRHLEGGITIISGLGDQAALHGALNKITRLGLKIISVQLHIEKGNSDKRT